LWLPVVDAFRTLAATPMADVPLFGGLRNYGVIV
jgi:hypothetical protein